MSSPLPAGAEDIAPPIGEKDFARFQSLIRREAGISLSSAKVALLVGRLAKRLRALGIEGFGRYYERVQADPEERVRMLDCVTTNETHFFREPRHFEYLAEELLPWWRTEASAGRRARRVLAWSAACSTGEEPFSLAMTLLRAFPPGTGWELDVLATDLSTRVLERARQATWPLAQAGEIPDADRKTFMLRGLGSQEGLMRAGPQLREVVRFARVNLAADAYQIAGRFDLILCRNVLIYFDAPTKAAVVKRLLGHLAPGGRLFLGHAESLSGTDHRVVGVAQTVYTQRDVEPRRGGAGSATGRTGS